MNNKNWTQDELRRYLARITKEGFRKDLHPEYKEFYRLKRQEIEAELAQLTFAE